MVEYSMDVYILKPVDLGCGNHKLVIDVNNRGGKRFSQLNNSPRTNDPTTAADAGEAFFMERGYTLAWNGWDISALPGDDRLTITVPVARNPDGSTIAGPSYEYISVNNDTTMAYALAYPAATLGLSGARVAEQALRQPSGGL